MFSDVADASDEYDKIDVSEPAILGGRVTFKITLKRTCPQNNWLYTFQSFNRVFYEDNTIIIGKVNNTGKDTSTYTLTLMNATSDYHKLKISFYCDSEPVDTVTLDLIGK